MCTETRARSASIVMRSLSKLITLLISNKKELNHFFKSRSSDIVLLILGNLHQNAKRYEARNIERKARRPLGRAPYRRPHSCERGEQIFSYIFQIIRTFMRDKE